MNAFSMILYSSVSNKFLRGIQYDVLYTSQEFHLEFGQISYLEGSRMDCPRYLPKILLLS